MSIWSDTDIIAGINKRDIAISPFDSAAVQPASVDLRLGRVFYEFSGKLLWLCENGNQVYIDPKLPVDGMMNRVTAMPDLGEQSEEYVIIPSQGFLLGATVEKISLGNNVVGHIEGKSSLARLGLSVHSTGGFIDPGNRDLNITLEICNHSPLPIRLYPGMWIAQIAFEYTLSECTRPYGPERGSRYYADGDPVPSRINENLGVSK
jgi:dCTP deaminase